MVSTNLKKWLSRALILSLFIGSDIHPALASTMSSGLPFESTLQLLKESISGPVLLSIAIILIVATCLMLAFGEWSDGFKRFINIVLWLSIAFGSVSFVTTMFGGGAVF